MLMSFQFSSFPFLSPCLHLPVSFPCLAAHSPSLPFSHLSPIMCEGNGFSSTSSLLTFAWIAMWLEESSQGGERAFPSPPMRQHSEKAHRVSPWSTGHDGQEEQCSGEQSSNPSSNTSSNPFLGLGRLLRTLSVPFSQWLLRLEFSVDFSQEY